MYDKSTMKAYLSRQKRQNDNVKDLNFYVLTLKKETICNFSKFIAIKCNKSYKWEATLLEIQILKNTL